MYLSLLIESCLATYMSPNRIKKMVFDLSITTENFKVLPLLRISRFYIYLYLHVTQQCWEICHIFINYYWNFQSPTLTKHFKVLPLLRLSRFHLYWSFQGSTSIENFNNWTKLRIAWSYHLRLINIQRLTLTNNLKVLPLQRISITGPNCEFHVLTTTDWLMFSDLHVTQQD